MNYWTKDTVHHVQSILEVVDVCQKDDVEPRRRAIENKHEAATCNWGQDFYFEMIDRHDKCEVTTQKNARLCFSSLLLLCFLPALLRVVAETIGAYIRQRIIAYQTLVVTEFVNLLDMDTPVNAMMGPNWT